MLMSWHAFDFRKGNVFFLPWRVMLSAAYNHDREKLSSSMKASWGKRFPFPGDTATRVMEKLFSRAVCSLGTMTIILWAWGYQMVHGRLSGRLWEPPPGNVIISWRGTQSSRLQWAATPSSHLWCAKLAFGEKTTDEVDVCMVSGSSWPVNIHYILSLLFLILMSRWRFSKRELCKRYSDSTPPPQFPPGYLWRT